MRRPLEIKLLVCLRILGRGSVADDIVEYTGLGETTVYNIFKTFLTTFTEKCYHSFVYFPTGEKRLDRTPYQSVLSEEVILATFF